MAVDELHQHEPPFGSQDSLIAGAALALSSEDQQSSARQVSIGSSFSTVVDVVDVDPSADGAAPPPKSIFWSSVVKVALAAEEHLAELFGLNQSKYQWAVDEFMDQQLSGEAPQKLPTLLGPNEQEMHPTGQQQTMHRDSAQVADVQIFLSP